MTISAANAEQAPANARPRPRPSASGRSGPRPAERAAGIPPFRVVEVLARAYELERQGQDVVHFVVGESDLPSAAPIVDAGIAALRDDRTRYTEALGLPALRQAIAERYADLDPGRVIVTVGASGALNLLALALVDAGQEVLLTDPGYPCNNVFVEAAGGIARLVPVGSETRFQLTSELVRAAWSADTAGVLVASPSNPTGSMIERDEARAIGDYAADRGFVIVDEIYQGLVYDGATNHASLLAVDDRFFIVNSFSKYFGMTGWRVGWLVAPEWAIGAIDRIAQNLYLAPPSLSQYAALAALEPQAIAIHEERRGIFAKRRDVLLKGLEALGLPAVQRPDGAFYAYVDIAETGLDGETFCKRLIEEYGVAVTPGTDFGFHRAAQHVRFSFTIDEGRIRKGLERLDDALRAFRKGPVAGATGRLP